MAFYPDLLIFTYVLKDLLLYALVRLYARFLHIGS